MKTKNNTAANFAFAAAAVLASTIATFKVDPAIDHSKDELLAPTTVEVGALTVFSAQGSDVKWDIYPEVPSQPFGEQESSLATAFQHSGHYLVVCSWLDEEGKVQLRKQPVQVGVPTPAPKRPSEPPVVDPDFSIVVEPVPDSYPNTAFPDVSDEVLAICQETDADAARCCELARNFNTIADKVDAGDYKLVAAVLRDTAALNKKVVRIDNTTTKIQLVVSRKRFDGELGDVKAYADLWRQIARGLSEHGQCQ